MELECTFHWIPMETVLGGSRIPTVSIRFRWILLEFQWNWKPKWLRLQPTGFRQNSNIPLGIRRNPPEVMEECKDLGEGAVSQQTDETAGGIPGVS